MAAETCARCAELEAALKEQDAAFEESARIAHENMLRYEKAEAALKVQAHTLSCSIEAVRDGSKLIADLRARLAAAEEAMGNLARDLRETCEARDRLRKEIDEVCDPNLRDALATVERLEQRWDTWMKATTTPVESELMRITLERDQLAAALRRIKLECRGHAEVLADEALAARPEEGP